MKYAYLQQNIVQTSDESPKNFDSKNLQELVDFFGSSDKNTCFLQGPQGAFKTALFNKACEYLNDNVLLFKIKCFEGTTLDDIFLSLFENLKKLSLMKKLKFAKIETNSISQRINSYLNAINLPVVILVDSLENIFNKNNQIEKEEVLNFIEHLNLMGKFKIVLISDFFDTKELQILFPQRITIASFTIEQTAEYFKKLDIKLNKEILKDFFDVTKGNPNHIFVSANIALTLRITIESLLAEFKTKTQIANYEEYILQKLMTFAVEKVRKSLHYLTLVNGGVSSDFLEEAGFFTKEQISYMCEKGILANEYDLIYLKGYLKKYLENNIPNFEKTKIHKFWKEFYELELPKKPANRTILISRNTMRNQIDYHRTFLGEISVDKTEDLENSETIDMSLLGYLKSNLTAWNFKNTNIDPIDTSPKAQQKQPSIIPESLKNKDQNFEKYELTKDELSLLNHPVDIEQKEKQAGVAKIIKIEQEIKAQSKPKLVDILSTAKSLEEAHAFDSAYGLYKSSIELTSDENYKQYLPEILHKLASCAKKMNQTTTALDWLNALVTYYSDADEVEKMQLARLEIAKIYKESYKINQAKVIYENFVNRKDYVSGLVLLHAYIALAQIEEDSANQDTAIDYYNNAFKIVENLSLEQTDSAFLAEAYFKYALILDDNNETDSAFEFYEKCTKNSKKPAIYTSSAYTNMGEITIEKGFVEKAIQYYKQALRADLTLSNHEGIYYLCQKLAQIYEKTDPQNVSNWLLKSLSAAKRTGEKSYIKQAYLKLAKYYQGENNTEKAKKALAFAEGIKNE